MTTDNDNEMAWLRRVAGVIGQIDPLVGGQGICGPGTIRSLISTARDHRDDPAVQAVEAAARAVCSPPHVVDFDYVGACERVDAIGRRLAAGEDFDLVAALRQVEVPGDPGLVSLAKYHRISTVAREAIESRMKELFRAEVERLSS